MILTDLIILVHSEPKITEECFKHLFQNTDMNKVRLIVVDNGADIKTKQVISKYIRKSDQRITMLTNVGFSKGVNTALDHIKAKYFCLLNNDVLVSPDWLEKMVHKLNDNPKAGAIGAISNFASGKQLLVPEDRGLTEEEYKKFKFTPTLDPKLIVDQGGKVQKLDNKNFEKFWRTPVLAFFAVLFRSEVLNKVGKLDEQFSPAYSEDWDYSFRMTEAGYDLLVDRETFLYHYGEVTAKEVLGKVMSKDAMYQISHQKLVKKWGQDFINRRFITDRDFMRLDPYSVTVAIPNMGTVSHTFLFDMLNLIRPKSTVLCDIPRTVIHFARNEAVKVALLNNTNYLFFLDSDVRFPGNILVNFLRQNKDVIGAVVTKRVPPYNPCVYKGRKIMPDTDQLGWTWLSKIGVGTQEIDGIGMAATLIKTKVLKKLEAPWFYFTKYLGEDLHFCERVQELGFKLYCDTNIACLHEGEMQFHGWEDFVKWAQENGGTLVTGTDAKELLDKEKRGGETDGTGNTNQ